MSEITTHPIPEPMLTAIGQIDTAVTALLEAQQLNKRMQEGTRVGSDGWRQHETIDDRLHDALSALGQ